MDTALQTKIFTGMDDFDLNRKIWDWQTANHVKIIKTHPDEHLSLQMKHYPQHEKIDQFPDQYSRRVDYLLAR